MKVIKNEMHGLRDELEQALKIMGSSVEAQKEEAEAEEDLSLPQYLLADSKA